MTDAQCRFALSLYDTASTEGEQTVVETLPNDEALAAFDRVDRASMHAYVGTLIKDLTEREQNILALYYYENLTLREIAGLLSLTEARISQILGKVLLTLRTRIAKTKSMAT